MFKKSVEFRSSRDQEEVYVHKELAPLVATAYKRKADKVRPVDAPLLDGSQPAGDPEWRQKAIARERYQPGKYSKFITGKFSNIKKGSRLTKARMATLDVGDLSPAEKDVFLNMLYNREAALAWDFSEIGLLREEVAPASRIRTVEHKPWQHPGFNIPLALHPKVVEMLTERLNASLLEPCHGPYRNPWFLVKKSKPGEYRMVGAAMEYNRYTIRDANLPANSDGFSESFAGEVVNSVIDFFSDYDQCLLHPESRDITAFQTPLGLLQLTRLVQGATNSVAQFCRAAGLALAA